MARGRPPARMPGLGRFGPVLVAAALLAAACSSGNTALPPPDEPPATVEPAQPPATSEPPPETPPEPTADPAEQAEPNGEADSEADLNGAAPADVAEGDAAASPDAEETAPPAGLSAGLEARLHALVAELAEIAGAWSPTGRAAVAVATADGKLYGFNEHRQHISASAVKPIWAAAAIDLAGLNAVAPLAEEALVRSDNFAAGEIIDLIGIDTVNDWSTDIAGSTGTHLAAWYFGTDRVAESVIAGGTRANFTTVADLALFYARLRRGELVDPGGVAALEGWLRATARGSTALGAVNGALLARLPEEVAAAAIHKTGWLPPYCCRGDVRLVIDAGTVPLPDGGWFAIAAVSDRGAAYNLSVDWVELAACRVYVLLAGDTSHACELLGDGTPRPELWLPPPEPEPEPEPEETGDAEIPADAEDADQPPSVEEPAADGGETPPEEISDDAEPAGSDDDTPAPGSEESPAGGDGEESPPGSSEPVPEAEEPAAEPAEAEPATDGSDSPSGSDSSG